MGAKICLSYASKMQKDDWCLELFSDVSLKILTKPQTITLAYEIKFASYTFDERLFFLCISPA